MKKTVNLLPNTLLRRMENRRQARGWLPVWAIACGLLCLGQMSLQHTIDNSRLLQTQLTKSTQPLAEMQKSITASRAKANKLQKEISRRQAIELSEAPLALLQIVAEARNDSGGAVWLDSYRMTEPVTPYVVGGQTGTKAKRPRKRLEVTGTSTSDAAVSLFVQSLRSSDAFASVKLEATQTAGGPATASRSFLLICEM